MPPSLIIGPACWQSRLKAHHSGASVTHHRPRLLAVKVEGSSLRCLCHSLGHLLQQHAWLGATHLARRRICKCPSSIYGRTRPDKPVHRWVVAGAGWIHVGDVRRLRQRCKLRQSLSPPARSFNLRRRAALQCFLIANHCSHSIQVCYLMASSVSQPFSTPAYCISH